MGQGPEGHAKGPRAAPWQRGAGKAFAPAGTAARGSGRGSHQQRTRVLRIRQDSTNELRNTRQLTSASVTLAKCQGRSEAAEGGSELRGGRRWRSGGRAPGRREGRRGAGAHNSLGAGLSPRPLRGRGGGGEGFEPEEEPGLGPGTWAALPPPPPPPLFPTPPRGRRHWSAAHWQLLRSVIIPFKPAAVFSIDLQAGRCSQQTVLGAVPADTEASGPRVGWRRRRDPSEATTEKRASSPAHEHSEGKRTLSNA